MLRGVDLLLTPQQRVHLGELALAEESLHRLTSHHTAARRRLGASLPQTRQQSLAMRR